jgi:hypothetical protein
MTEVECAEYASNILGEEEVEAASLGMSYGESDAANRGSINRVRVRRKIVMPEEIRNQEILHAYAKLCHHQPVKLSFQASKVKAQNEPMILWQHCVSELSKTEGYGVYSSSGTRS